MIDFEIACRWLSRSAMLLVMAADLYGSQPCAGQNRRAEAPVGQGPASEQAVFLRASRLLDTPVVDLVGTPVGAVDDVLIDVESSRVAAFLVRPASDDDEQAGEAAEIAPSKVLPAAMAIYHAGGAGGLATIRLSIPAASHIWRDAPTWPPIDAAGAPLVDRLVWLNDVYRHFGRAWQPPCVDRWWGWAPGSDYNALFAPDRKITLRGTVLGVAAAWPVCVLVPGVRVWVEVEGLVWGVDLGPIWHVVDQNLGLEPGKAIEVRGCEALISPDRLVLPVEVTYEGRTFRLRADDGIPVWGAPAPVATLKLFRELDAVANFAGDALGRIADLVIEPGTWCVAFAAFGAPGEATSLAVVPASLLTADPTGDGLRVAIGASAQDAGAGGSVPRIDAANWPANVLAAPFARRLSAHYGVPFCGQPACTHVATDFASRGMFGHALGRVIAIEPCAVPADAAPPDRWTLKLLTAGGPAWVTFDAEPVRRTDLEIAIGDVVAAWGWPDSTRRCELHAGILEANGRYLRVRDAAP